ncbi:DUF2188 domain-containing protein [Cupriavidus necator]
MEARIIRIKPAEYGWILEIEGFKEQPQRFPTLEAAIAAGWALAARVDAEWYIRRQDREVHLRAASRDGQHLR